MTSFFFNICFIQELKKYGVTTIVRVCEATYDTTLVEKEGIHVLVSISWLLCFYSIVLQKFIHIEIELFEIDGLSYK